MRLRRMCGSPVLRRAAAALPGDETALTVLSCAAGGRTGCRRISPADLIIPNIRSIAKSFYEPLFYFEASSAV